MTSDIVESCVVVAHGGSCTACGLVVGIPERFGCDVCGAAIELDGPMLCEQAVHPDANRRRHIHVDCREPQDWGQWW